MQESKMRVVAVVCCVLPIFSMRFAQPSSDCSSSSYNNISLESYKLNRDFFTSGRLTPPSQYLFPNVTFNCRGCLSNITFYTNDQTTASSTNFDILLWRINSTDTSADNSLTYVNEPGHIFPIDVIQPLQFQPFGDNDFTLTIPLTEHNICFEAGCTFGLRIPDQDEFGLIVLREKAVFSNFTTYNRKLSSTLVSSVWQVDNADNNILIAVDVIEPNIITTSIHLTSSTPSSSVFPSSLTSTAVTLTTQLLHTSPATTLVHSMSTVTPHSSSTPSSTNSPTSPQIQTIAIAGGVVGGALIAVVCVSVLVVMFSLLQSKRRKFKPKSVLDPVLAGSESFTLGALPTHHQYEDVREISAAGAGSGITPTTTQVNIPHSVPHNTYEEPGTPNGEYTQMSALIVTPPYDSDNEPHYKVPRSSQPNYDVPRPANFSDYEDPSGLLSTQKVTTRQQPIYFELENTAAPKPQQQAIYFELENPNTANQGNHDYHVLDQNPQQAHDQDTLAGGQQFFESDISFSHEQTNYWEPAQQTEDIYAQLSQIKCKEIAREDLKFVEDIGEGEFGTVSKEIWKQRGMIQKEVAVKRLKVEASEEEKSRFLREGARMVQFFHTNVVKLHGMVTIGEPVMLVVELMPKGDLLNYLKDLRLNHNIPSMDQLLRFGKDIALGMKHMTKKGFVHRDLAARNVFLNEGLICKIGDFGMTRASDHVFDMSRVENVPLRWTAPEAIEHRHYSEKSDVYSFGMVLFEIWSLGRKPFQQHDNNTVLQFIKQGGIQSPPPGCPRGVYELMVNCWNPDYKRRQTFEDICEYLNVPDDSLLHWATQDTRISKKAMQIGADVHYGSVLYQDLQRVYRNDEQEDD